MDWGTDANFVYDPISMKDGFGVTFEAISASGCSAIKAKGYTMMTLETKYITPANVDWAYVQRLNYIQNTLAPIITSNLSSCASQPWNYYQASSSDEIASAVANMFAATTSLRLTQ